MTVTAHEPGGLAADQEFTVTVAPVLRRLKIRFSQEIAPTWSPDGARIAFASTRDGNRGEVYVCGRST